MLRARFVLYLAALAGLARAGDYTALDRYIAALDGSYRYSLVRTLPAPGAGFTAFFVELTFLGRMIFH